MEEAKKTCAQRIQEALELQKMKQADLVELTGLGKSAISQYVSGKYEPKQIALHKMAKALSVSEAWLMGYNAPMERTDLTASDAQPSTETAQLLQYYKSLNDKGKQEATKRVEELTYIPMYTETEILQAAHARTDIDITEDMIKNDDDIMSDENF